MEDSSPKTATSNYLLPLAIGENFVVFCYNNNELIRASDRIATSILGMESLSILSG